MKKLLANSELPYTTSRPCRISTPGGVSVRNATSSPTGTGPARSRPARKCAAPVRRTPVSVVAHPCSPVCRNSTAIMSPGSPTRLPTERVSEKSGGASRGARIGWTPRSKATCMVRYSPPYKRAPGSTTTSSGRST